MKARGKIAGIVAIASLASVGTAFAAAESVTKVTAEPLVSVRAITVDYSDLDLQSPKAQETLFFRLSRAAEEACGAQTYRQAGSVALAARNRACFDEALSEALSEVSASAVAKSN